MKGIESVNKPELAKIRREAWAEAQLNLGKSFDSMHLVSRFGDKGVKKIGKALMVYPTKLI